MNLRFGTALRNFVTASETLDMEAIVGYAKKAEELGLDSVWVWDHILLGSRTPFPVFDSLITLAAVAASTKRIRLGTGVLVLPLRNPVVLAKQTATIDCASGGRLSLGVAAGWYKKEFDAVGVQHNERGRIFLQNLRVLYDLWKEEGLNGEEGPHVFRNTVMAPAPSQRPRPEVLIGGYVERVLRRAGEHSDGWLNYFYLPDSFARAWKQVRDFAAEAGRDPDKLTNISQLPICVADTYAEGDRLIKEFLVANHDLPAWSECSFESAIRGTPEQCAEQLAAQVEAGVQHFVFVPYGYRTDQLETIANDVIPKVRKGVAA